MDLAELLGFHDEEVAALRNLGIPDFYLKLQSFLS